MECTEDRTWRTGPVACLSESLGEPGWWYAVASLIEPSPSRLHVRLSYARERRHRCSRQSHVRDRRQRVPVLPRRLRAGGGPVPHHVQSQSAVVSVSRRGSVQSRCAAFRPWRGGGAETSRTECVDLSLSSGTTVSTPLSGLECKLWETEGRAKCVCLMAFQCP